MAEALKRPLERRQRATGGFGRLGCRGGRNRNPGRSLGPPAREFARAVVLVPALVAIIVIQAGMIALGAPPVALTCIVRSALAPGRGNERADNKIGAGDG